jgi:prepilin-type N-terminal cleavage/methylation domain-containing protein
MPFAPSASVGPSSNAADSRPTSARRVSQAGMTLMEVLVALVILASAAAVILTHTRTLLDHSRRLRAQDEDAQATLNRVGLLRMAEAGRLRVEAEIDHLRLEEGPLRLAEIRNFAVDGQTDLPPIDQAYTPYQIYSLSQGRYAIRLVLPSLPSPQ